jgi:nucleoside-diphosphate-sugar epimerase
LDGFEFVSADIRDSNEMVRAVEGVEAVIHLAALVGEPACALDVAETRGINYQAVCDLLQVSQAAGVRRFVFCSTCSNYGMANTQVLADEEMPLNPVSLYAETKVAAEKEVLDAAWDDFSTTVLRLATVFGLAPRMRFDLLINELVRDAVVGRPVQIYGPKAWRPFLHVSDAARAFQTILEAPIQQVQGEVFNVGEGNYRKETLVDLLTRQVPNVNIEILPGKVDPRDYRLSFDKIQRALGFRAERDVEFGIAEIQRAIQQGIFCDPTSSRYQNVA